MIILNPNTTHNFLDLSDYFGPGSSPTDISNDPVALS